MRHVLSAAAIELSGPSGDTSGTGGGGAKGDLMAAVGLVSRVSGRTPLHHAAEAGDLASVRMLLDAHAHLVPWIVHTHTHTHTLSENECCELLAAASPRAHMQYLRPCVCLCCASVFFCVPTSLCIAASAPLRPSVGMTYPHVHAHHQGQ